MRIAVLVKQVPAIEEIGLGADGRLARSGVPLEMNPHCRRAVAKGVELAGETGGSCTALTMGPGQARQVLVEALDFGCDAAVLISDPALAGSDTLVTARALAAALRLAGPFDLVLCGRNSVDADTGQVGPQLAELAGLPFLSGVRELDMADGTVTARTERDDGWRVSTVPLPAVLSCAERLCAPAKRPGAVETAAMRDRIRVVTTAELGTGPWGQDGSPTRVGRLRQVASARAGTVLTGDLADQVERIARLLEASWTEVAGQSRTGVGVPGDLTTVPSCTAPSGTVPSCTAPSGTVTAGSAPSGTVAAGSAPSAAAPAIAVLAQPGRARVTRELLGAAARLSPGAVTAVLAAADLAPLTAECWGADAAVVVPGRPVEEDLAAALAPWCLLQGVRVLLAPATSWGREVAGRIAARTGAGLVGDAVELALAEGSLVGGKPVAGGGVLADVHVDSALQLATVRPGVLAPAVARVPAGIPVRTLEATSVSRVRHLKQWLDRGIDALAAARIVIGVGAGVDPSGYPLIEELAAAIGAEVAATRKVTDQGRQPQGRQVGVTGRGIAPDVYVAIGVSGKHHHLVGVRRAGAIVAVNHDPEAPIFRGADLGVVADWRAVTRALTRRLGTARATGAMAGP